MIRIALVLAGLLVAPLAAAQGRTDLIALARAAPMARIETERGRCGDARTFGVWFDELVRPHAGQVRWSAGVCRTVRPETPRDSGGADVRCARAEILPRGQRRTVLMEVYLQRSGARWQAYAFRAVGDPNEGWEDYIRFPTEFETTWRALRGLPSLPEPDEEGCRFGEAPPGTARPETGEPPGAE